MTNKLSLSLTICSFQECKKIMNAISYVHCMQQSDAEREYNSQYSFAVAVSNVENRRWVLVCQIYCWLCLAAVLSSSVVNYKSQRNDCCCYTKKATLSVCSRRIEIPCMVRW